MVPFFGFSVPIYPGISTASTEPYQ